MLAPRPFQKHTQKLFKKTPSKKTSRCNMWAGWLGGSFRTEEKREYRGHEQWPKSPHGAKGVVVDIYIYIHMYVCMCSDMRSDQQHINRNAYRYISLFMPIIFSQTRVLLPEEILQHFWAPCKAPTSLRRLARRHKIHCFIAVYVRAPCKAP